MAQKLLPERGRIAKIDPKPIPEGEEARDERAMGRIFGEALPSGLVLQVFVQEINA